jgi:ubiquinone biosynthesis protein COQ9
VTDHVTNNTNNTIDLAAARIMDQAMVLAPQFGWTDDMLIRAARMAGKDPSVLAVIAPDGAADILCRYLSGKTRAAIDQVGLPDDAGIRDRIQAIIMKRFELMLADMPALERGIGVLHHPKNWRKGLRRAYHDADQIWLAVGDTATDYNRYTKRILLSRILIHSMPVFIANTGDLDSVAKDVRKRLDRTVKIGGWLGKTAGRIRSGVGRILP